MILKRVLLFGSVPLLVFFLAHRILSLIYFREGAYFLDAGWFSYSLGHESFGENPRIFGSEYGKYIFGVHTFFGPWAITKGLAFFVGSLQGYILFLSIQLMLVGILGGALGYLIQKLLLGNRHPWTFVLLGQIALSLSNMSMGSILYPHVEPFGAALGALGTLLVFHNNVTIKSTLRYLVGSFFLIAAVLSREDIAFHLGFVAVSIFIAHWFQTKDRYYFALKLAAVFYVSGACLFLLKAKLFSDTPSLLVKMYLGDPLFSHINPLELTTRFQYLMTYRLDLVLLLVLPLILVAVSRDFRLLGFTLSAAPWVLINFLATDPAKYQLNSYHQFAFLMYLVVPVINLAILKKLNPEQDSRKVNTGIGLTAAFSVFIIIVAGLAQPPVGNGYWPKILADNAEITSSDLLKNEQIAKSLENHGNLYLDDAMLSITPQLLGQNVNSINSINFQSSDTLQVIYMPRYVLGMASISELFLTSKKEGFDAEITCLSKDIASIEFTKSGKSHEGKSLEISRTICEN